MSDNQPPVIKALHDLIVAWVRHVEHIPRMHRHTLGARITESFLDAQMHVFHAQPLDDRLQRIEAAQARKGVLSASDAQWALPKMNSYLGLTGQLAAQRWEVKWLKSLDAEWWQVLRVSGQKMVIARHCRRVTET